MGIGVAVHGVIQFPGWGAQAPSRAALRHNKMVIRSLPSLDSDWPFITRSMFAFAPYRPAVDIAVPQYEQALIHFAGSYKNLYLLSGEWIRKFEAILERLCWYRTVVYNEFSQIQYVWEANWPREDFISLPPKPPRQWLLKCYARNRKEVPYADAIDGPYNGFVPGK